MSEIVYVQQQTINTSVTIEQLKLQNNITLDIRLM